LLKANESIDGGGLEDAAIQPTRFGLVTRSLTRTFQIDHCVRLDAGAETARHDTPAETAEFDRPKVNFFGTV
jgi:hypothetical protein